MLLDSSTTLLYVARLEPTLAAFLASLLRSAASRKATLRTCFFFPKERARLKKTTCAGAGAPSFPRELHAQIQPRIAWSQRSSLHAHCCCSAVMMKHGGETVTHIYIRNDAKNTSVPFREAQFGHRPRDQRHRTPHPGTKQFTHLHSTFTLSVSSVEKLATTPYAHLRRRTWLNTDSSAHRLTCAISR